MELAALEASAVRFQERGMRIPSVRDRRRRLSRLLWGPLSFRFPIPLYYPFSRLSQFSYLDISAIFSFPAIPHISAIKISISPPPLSLVSIFLYYAGFLCFRYLFLIAYCIDLNQFI